MSKALSPDDNTDNRQKRELQPDIIHDGKRIQKCQKSGNKNRQKQLRESMSEKLSGISDNAHQSRSPDRCITTDQKDESSDSSRDDRDTQCHRNTSQEKRKENDQHHDVTSAHDHQMHQSRITKLVTQLSIHISSLSK